MNDLLDHFANENPFEDLPNHELSAEIFEVINDSYLTVDQKLVLMTAAARLHPKELIETQSNN